MGHIRYSGAGQYQGHSGIHAHVNNVLQGMTDASSMPNHIEPQAGGLDSRTSQPNVPRMIPNPAHPENAGGGAAPAAAGTQQPSVAGPQNFSRGGPAGVGAPTTGPTQPSVQTPYRPAGPTRQPLGTGAGGTDPRTPGSWGKSLDKMLYKAFKNKPRGYSKTWGV